jgi:rubrerythrin
MKIKTVAALCFGLSALFFLLGTATARLGPSVSKATMDNLSTAMHGEAFAYSKYMLYAEHARQNSDNDLANLFASAAETERFEHFAEEARMAGLVGSDADNLKDAIRGESYEVETMYREFSRQALAAGDKDAAERFEEIRHDEMNHRDAFTSALARLEKSSSGAN